VSHLEDNGRRLIHQHFNDEADAAVTDGNFPADGRRRSRQDAVGELQ